jgi:signal peptidase I
VVVRDESMLPTLRPGDRLLVDLRAYRGRSPRPGEIVVVTDPTDRARWLVKRATAVGPASVGGGGTPGGPNDLPAGWLWVQGDAEDASRDSRRFGPLPPESLVGRVYRCYAPPERRRPL